MTIYAKCIVTKRFPVSDQPEIEPIAHVYISDIIDTEAEAVAEATKVLEDQPARSEIVIQRVGDLIPLRFKPQTNTTEVSCKSNIDPAAGKHGSVCDIKKNDQSKDSVHPAVQPLNNEQKTGAKHEALTKLTSLIQDRCSVPSEEAEYKALRFRVAQLRAYLRALVQLEEQSMETLTTGAAQIEQLDAQHPLFQTLFCDHYKETMKQSGFNLDPSNENCVLNYLFSGESKNALHSNRDTVPNCDEIVIPPLSEV